MSFSSSLTFCSKVFNKPVSLQASKQCVLLYNGHTKSTSDLLVPQAKHVNLSSLLEEKSDLIVLDRGSKIRSLWRSIPCVTRAKLSLLGESNLESSVSTAFGATFVSCLALNWFLPIVQCQLKWNQQPSTLQPQKKKFPISKKTSAALQVTSLSLPEISAFG